LDRKPGTLQEVALGVIQKVAEETDGDLLRPRGRTA